jgi:signal transduction histidine kinase
MISLINRDTQYIIAESTQTLSSQSDDVYQRGDSLLMGVRMIRRTEGLCGYALASGFRRDCRCSQREHDDIEKEGGSTGADVQKSLEATVLSDLTKEEQFKDAPFVVNEPKTLFYAGVPIRTKAGYTIGSYCVMDDTPRSGLSDAELEFLRDMALTVMEHLEFMTIRDDHGRSEQMLKALGLFVEGRSSISEWWLRTSDKEGSSITYNSASYSREESDVERELQLFKIVGDSSTPTTSSEHVPRSTEQLRSSGGSNNKPRKSQASARTDQDHHEVPRKVSEDVLNEKIEQLALNSKRHYEAGLRQENQDNKLPAEAPTKINGTPSSTPKTDHSQDQIKAMFSRASNLIRESTGVDGAIFFDASFKGFGAKAYHRNSRRRGPELSSSEDGSRHRSSDTNDTGSSAVENNPSKSSISSQYRANPQYCDVLGFSTEATSSLNGQEAASYHLTVADEFVSKIFRRYPHGKIFAFDEDGGISSSEEDTFRTAKKGIMLTDKKEDRGKRSTSRKDEASSILQIFPGSRFIMVFPLWDSHREKWYASSMLWTSDPTRVLTAKDDMSYMASFSNNIMAEVFRLEVRAANHAKSTFISSISHELRSPLHGIMGSLELLRDTSLTRFQDETMDAIKQCSTTLLDTLNHVLDYAKINNFITGQRKEMKLAKRYKHSRKARPAEGVAQYGAISLASNFSLDVVTEEVVQAIYLGHHHAQLSIATDPADEPRSPHGSGPRKQQVLVILDVDWASRWRFHGQSGAWRRILMNLFGNALKYTTSGFINVRLECQEGGKSKLHSNVTLTVSDSGKGVSTNFIEDRIFTPFAQEDSLSPGTGLGLSIVRQIVEHLHGNIDFQSVLGSGTSVTVTLPFDRSTHFDSSISGDAVVDLEVISQAKAYIKNKKLGFVIADESGGSETQGVENNARHDSLVLLNTALLRMARQCFDVETLSGVDLEHSEADIYVTTQEGFERSTENVRKPALGTTGGSPLIVITNSVSSWRRSEPGLPLSFLSHP